MPPASVFTELGSISPPSTPTGCNAWSNSTADISSGLNPTVSGNRSGCSTIAEIIPTSAAIGGLTNSGSNM